MPSRDKKNMLLGALIGGATGICAASIFYSVNKGKTPSEQVSIEEIEDLICHMGKILKTHNLDMPASLMKDTEKQVKRNEDKLSGVLEMISAGLHIWEAFKNR